MRHTPHPCLKKKKIRKNNWCLLHSFKLSLTSSKSDDDSIQLLHNRLMRRRLRSASKISKWVMVWMIAMLMILENRGRKKTIIIIIIIITETNCHAMPATRNAASLRAEVRCGSGKSVREQRTGRNHTKQPRRLHNAAIACWGGFFRRVLKWSPFVRSLRGVLSWGVFLWDSFCQHTEIMVYVLKLSVK